MKANGDCYEIHAKMMMEQFTGENPLSLLLNNDARLCHGSVWHPEVGRHGHCWIELNEDMVLDFSNGHQVILQRERYYEVGKIQKVRRYTPEQVRENLLKCGTYGDWV